jgi:hypothetical protein
MSGEIHYVGMASSEASPSHYDDSAPPSHNFSVGSRCLQWTTSNDRDYIPVGRSVNALPPGAYEISVSNNQLYFSKFDLNVSDLLVLPGTILHDIVDEINRFWDLYDRFKAFKIRHRRGILIGGPGGCGKSCTLKQVAADVIGRGGIVIPYADPELLLAGMRYFREIQPETPVVILMEDLESILSHDKRGQSRVLNLLDGMLSDSFDRVVFMATTNYFEDLERRITNRPSRFDRVFAIDHPNHESRFQYLNYLIEGKPDVGGLDIGKVAVDTEGLSFAHLKEIVTSVVIIGNEYESVLKTVKKMATESLPTGDDMEFDVMRGEMGYQPMRKRR